MSAVPFSSAFRAACNRKARYQSEESAQTVATAANAVKRSNNVRPYRCDFCDGWHLTSRSTFPAQGR